MFGERLFDDVPRWKFCLGGHLGYAQVDLVGRAFGEVVQQVTASESAWMVMLPVVASESASPPGGVRLFVPGRPCCAERGHLLSELWAQVAMAAGGGCQDQVAPSCVAHAGKVQPLVGLAILAGAVASYQPGIQVWRNLGPLADKCLDDFLLIPYFATGI